MSSPGPPAPDPHVQPSRPAALCEGCLPGVQWQGVRGPPPPRALVQADGLQVSALCGEPGSSCRENLPTRAVIPAIAAASPVKSGLCPSGQKPGLAGRAFGSQKEQPGRSEGEAEGSKRLLRAESQAPAGGQWAGRPWERGEGGSDGAESSTRCSRAQQEDVGQMWGLAVNVSLSLSLCTFKLADLGE